MVASIISNMEEPPKDIKIDFIPREYQLDLLNEVKKMNSILFLPTGSGKTYIATMLIKEMGESLIKPSGKGRKWTIFIVHSVALVGQHANTLRKHLPWTVGAFSGDMSVDFWSQNQWSEILEKCHILIMTAQIYLNNLHHGYMRLKDANLIVFDECHHAVAGHPFRQIMLLYHSTNFEQNKNPHILGLTATLVNSNVKNVVEELSKLQQTFAATIITRYETDIQIFSANPKEIIWMYDENIFDEEITSIVNRIKLFQDKIKKIKSPSKVDPINDDGHIYYLENNKQTSKLLANYFKDIEVMLTDSGVYAAYLSTWHYILEVEKKKKTCNDINQFMLLSMTLSEITIVRKMLFDYMKKKTSNIENSLSLINNASPKLKELMKILSSIERTDTCLVFVDRRTTAKMLYHYIQDYTVTFKQNKIVCEFIVGTGGISFESKEMTFKKLKNNDIIKKFNENVINVLITSDVLEEGVDVQICNYVIRYDTPKSFPSYVQSKGRARSNDSKFIVMVPNKLKFEKVQSDYIQMEEDIQNILLHNKIDDDTVEEDVGDVFKTQFATLTHDIAISIINRYCYSLPQDRFTNLGPEWYIANKHEIDSKTKFKYRLLLPMNSAIRSTHIDGEFFANKKNAKKSAAFNACIQLYKVGALDDNLLPVTITDTSVFDHSKWFPHWNNNDTEASKYNLKPGTNKMKRMVHIESSSYLHRAYPQGNKSSHLHILHCTPNYCQLKNTKYKAFDGMLLSNKGFGILTSKELPSVSNFPIFLNFGDVNVSIKVNIASIHLTQENLKKLEEFHNKLFIDVLGIKEFIVRSYKNEKNSYLVVPIDFSGGNYNIDWKVVDIKTLVETEKPPLEQRKSNFVEENLETDNVISPWYRNIDPIQRYIVTDVYYDMTPSSAFPTSDYDTYESYFSNKYNISVTNQNQPMIQVKSLGVSKINYLTPRFLTSKTDKRSEYVEILVPEFCMWHKFPSAYWFKALMLPTILYRLSKLLLAEDLLIKVNSMCDIVVQKESDVVDTVEMDKFCVVNELKKKHIILPISDTLKYMKNTHNSIINELNSNCPIDIDRQKNTTLLDVLNYHRFMNSSDISNGNTDTVSKRAKVKKLSHPLNLDKVMFDAEIEVENNVIKSDARIELIDINDIFKNVLFEFNEICLTNNEPPALSPLFKQHPNQKIGPMQSDILKVITPPYANDMFDYERMETYGDSFLKFSVSLVLFDAFESENEGVLTELKMKIVGNRNLLYVGKNLNIGSYLTVNVFEPISDWVPPCFMVPQQLKEIIIESNIQSDVLHQIEIPKNDQFSGILSDKTWEEIENKVLKFEKNSKTPSSSGENVLPLLGHSQSDLFIHKQSVSDKMVADSIESLIGVYVFKRGIEDGFKIINGLGIIPKEFIYAFKPKPIINNEMFNHINYSNILPGYELLEKRIDYTFKHKHLLVQAMTHPTYQLGFSECYQRLEFLGDAILDFLITTYIVEHCYNKTPGEITDIRSSLVNNITFASLSVRIGLHKFVLAKSVQLTEAIDRFFEHQQKNNHQIGQEVLYLIEESDCFAAESIDVPKVLGDLFESLIAAIYIDCGRDLNFVWKICYRFMENEINEFCTNVPKNPIRILHETKLQPSFSKPPASALATARGLGCMIQLDVFLNNKNMTIYGFGQNKKEAKVAAAKMALKNMKEMLLS